MMSTETDLQAKIIRYLKDKHCYVLRLKSGPNYPAGCPDIIFMLEGFWGAIEVKAGPRAKFQPLQRETLAKFDAWSWARCVNPDNWPEIRQELEGML